jgi:hypothetical protein
MPIIDRLVHPRKKNTITTAYCISLYTSAVLFSLVPQSYSEKTEDSYTSLLRYLYPSNISHQHVAVLIPKD